MFDFEEFIEKPSNENLHKCKKDDWINLAKHCIPLKSNARKSEIRELVLQTLVKESALPTESLDIDGNVTVSLNKTEADSLELQKLNFERYKFEKELEERARTTISVRTYQGEGGKPYSS